MDSQNVKRKLAAILNADVKGYSRLMSDDEMMTIQTLTAYREVMTNMILGHQGRVVDSPGDNLLAEFDSVLNAIECAVDIQKQCDLARKAGDNGGMLRQARIVGFHTLGGYVGAQNRVDSQIAARDPALTMAVSNS